MSEWAASILGGGDIDVGQVYGTDSAGFAVPVSGTDMQATVSEGYSPAIATAITARMRAQAQWRQRQFRQGKLTPYVATLGVANLNRYLQGLPIERTPQEKAAAAVMNMKPVKKNFYKRKQRRVNAWKNMRRGTKRQAAPARRPAKRARRS